MKKSSSATATRRNERQRKQEERSEVINIDSLLKEARSEASVIPSPKKYDESNNTAVSMLGSSSRGFDKPNYQSRYYTPMLSEAEWLEIPEEFRPTRRNKQSFRVYPTSNRAKLYNSTDRDRLVNKVVARIKTVTRGIGINSVYRETYKDIEFICMENWLTNTPGDTHEACLEHSKDIWDRLDPDTKACVTTGTMRTYFRVDKKGPFLITKFKVDIDEALVF